LALFAAVIRSLIPQGFMPAVENGAFSIVLCTANGLEVHDADGSPRSPLQDAMAAVHAPCAFAALATLAPPPAAPVAGQPAEVRAAEASEAEAPADPVRQRFRQQAPRAPPAQA
ncbi:MAG: hypothetical protein JNL56_00815, partial [Alphaproteobacteria bacterium]|nr:hypothetical protein [Alphaproteobacteria bacterium]